jgi:peptidoglycan/LPS O-acetylase OafA/YrhL
MNYRAEINVLRALAVLPVILFHAGFDLFVVDKIIELLVN